MNARLMRAGWLMALAAYAGPGGLEAPAAVRYVSPSGLHQPPFETWTDAATNIQAAVDAAEAGDTVLVTNGTYTPFVAYRNRLMTGPMSPAPASVTASSYWSTGYEGWRAFSGTAFWGVYPWTSPQWLLYDSGMPDGIRFDAYLVQCPLWGDANSISEWQVQVSSDSTNWTPVDVRNELLMEDFSYIFNLAQPVTTRYVRIYITKLRNSGTRGTLRCFLGSSLVVTSANGAAQTIIQAAGQREGAVLAASRMDGFQVVSGLTAGVSFGRVRNCLVTNTLGVGIRDAFDAEGCQVVNSQGYGAFNVLRLEDSTIENSELNGVYQCAQVKRCLVRGNGASASSGGGIYMSTPSGVIDTCMLISNRAVNGGGVYLVYGVMQNCFVYGNRASSDGGGIFFTWNDVKAMHCTVMGNTARYGGGVIYGTIYNSILYGNSAWVQGSNHHSSALSYSCTMPNPGGVGNIAAPPGLLGPGNPHIGASSPCVNAGSLSWATGDYDVDGEPRIWGGGVDIGCDEVFSPGLTGALAVVLSVNFTRAVVNYPVRFDSAVEGKADGFQLSFGDGLVVTNTSSMAHGYGSVGVYEAVLTAWNLDGSASATTTVEVFSGYTNYVSLSGGHVWPFTNQPDAATDIPAAISANIPGGVVIVADGTYDQGGVLVSGALTNRIALTNAVTVRSMNGPGGVIVAGQGPAGPAAVRCAYIGSGSRLEGFTLTNGNTLAGGAETETQGGGAWIESGGVMSNCVVSGNMASRGGGGVRGGEIWNSRLSGNTAAFGGGAFGSVLRNSRVLANTVSSNGGGAHGGFLWNCLVADNQARYGGGTASSSNHHCTISRNAAGISGGGIYRATTLNSVVYHNTASNSWPEFFNSICNFTCTNPDPAGTGNVTNDPAFKEYAGGDFRLQDGSLCVDAALGGGSPAVDLDGVPRPLDGNDDGTAAPDMGAYEAVHATADTDGDGLGDSNEYYSVGTSPVLRDTDGDDQSDGDELIAGFDPLDIDSFFAILRVSPPRSTVAAFYWPGAAGRLYTLRVTPSLEQEFTNLPEYVDQPGFDGTMGFTNPASSSMEFFGVSVRLGP